MSVELSGWCRLARCLVLISFVLFCSLSSSSVCDPLATEYLKSTKKFLTCCVKQSRFEPRGRHVKHIAPDRMASAGAEVSQSTTPGTGAARVAETIEAVAPVGLIRVPRGEEVGSISRWPQRGEPQWTSLAERISRLDRKPAGRHPNGWGPPPLRVLSGRPYADLLYILWSFTVSARYLSVLPGTEVVKATRRRVCEEVGAKRRRRGDVTVLSAVMRSSGGGFHTT